MFLLPELSEIEVEISKERGLLSGAEFLYSSGELSSAGKFEVQEAIQLAKLRIEKFNTLSQIVKVLHDMDYTNRPNQFASQEVINEFRRLIGNATLVLEDFRPPVEVDINITEG